MRPIIGVVARPFVTDDGRLTLSISEQIRKAILLSGGIPIVILPTKDIYYYENKESELTSVDKEILDKQISICDGIIMPGGNRIYFYDKFICSQANKKHLPLFGICMGMQVMGTYNNNIKNTRVENHKPGHYDYHHKVSIIKNTKLYEILQKDEIEVNSYHNYALSSSGNYDICANSDNVIEAIEKKEESFNLGVQWHPEYTLDENDKKLFDAFIDACKKYNYSK